MKKILSLLLVVLSVYSANAQIFATDEHGNEVVLFTNGKWEQIYDTLPPLKLDAKAGLTLEKDAEDIFLVKSNYTNGGFYINPKKWTFEKSAYEALEEYSIDPRDEEGSVYGLFIPCNGYEVNSLESLTALAFQDAKLLAEQYELISQDYVTINGDKLIQIVYKGTYDTNAVINYDYYFYGEEGSAYLNVYYKGHEIDPVKEKEVFKLANGLVGNIAE